MSRYLMTIRSSAPLVAPAERLPPADYLLESSVEPGAGPDDGLAHWGVDLQLVGSFSTWASGPAFDSFWSYLAVVVAAEELRPRLALRILSRSDAHSVSATVSYLGDHELKRAADGIRQKLQTMTDPKTKKLTADVSLAL